MKLLLVFYGRFTMEVKIPIASLILLVLAALIIVHQIVLWGSIWSWRDFIHHETLVAICILTALLLLLLANGKLKVKTLKI